MICDNIMIVLLESIFCFIRKYFTTNVAMICIPIQCMQWNLAVILL